MKDTKNNLLVEVAVPVTAFAGNITMVGEPIDLKGYNSCTFAVYAGQTTDGTYTPAIFESDTGVFSGEETAVSDDDLLGTEALAAISGGADQVVKTLGYIGQKRYVQARLVSTSVTTGGSVGILAIKGHPYIAPVA